MKLSILAYIIKKVQQGLGIVQDTDTATRAISSGKYVFWKNKFKKASTNIAENDTLSMSNLVDVNDGALNEIADHIVSLEANTQGTAVSIAGYTPSNKYTTTSDGYLYVSSTAAASDVYIEDDSNTIVGKVSGVITTCVFIRKGMRMYCNSITGAAYFKPLV